MEVVSEGSNLTMGSIMALRYGSLVDRVISAMAVTVFICGCGPQEQSPVAELMSPCQLTWKTRTCGSATRVGDRSMG